MSKFLRDNAAIVIGAALPVVVVLFFVLATQLPKAYVPPPAHDLVLMSQNGPYDVRPLRVQVRVEDGRLRVRTYKLDYAGNAVVSYGQVVPRLFLWSHATHSVRELALELPEVGDTFVEGMEARVAELADRRLSNDTLAPDGYRFRTEGHDNGVFGLFFNRYEPRTLLEKDGAVERIALPTEVPYWGVQFVGWVIE